MVKRSSLLFLLVSALLCLPVPAAAQIEGFITGGYRFTDVKGRQQKYNELFNLRDGFRIHDLSLYGRTESEDKFADTFTLDASGIGGDPFMGSQLKLSKERVYDLRVNYRQSYFYWDRNDAQAHPTGLNGLTTNHDFATVRRIGSVNASVYATPSLRLSMEYQRSARDGTLFTTRTLDYFGAPTTYAGFLRANPYYVEMDVDEAADRVTGGLSYSIRDWNVFYRTGYQVYNEELKISNPVSPQRSINVDEAATANELLTSARWDEVRRLTTPISEFSYNGAPHSRLKLRGGYIYYRFRGPATIDATFAGRARTTNASTVAPFTATVVNEATVEEPNHIIDQGFTLSLQNNLLFHADYRYSRFTMDNAVDYTSADGGGNHTGEEHVAWKQGLQILDLAFEFTPIPKFLIRPGIRLMKRDLRVERDGVLDVQSSKPSKYASPLVSVYYSPTNRFSLRGDLRNTTNGGPYTRISPRTDFRTRWIARYQLTDAILLENNFTLREAEFTTTEFLNTTRSNATTATYALNANYSVFGGFIYDSFLATSAVTFLRGTAPLAATWRDQSISRVWEGGVEARPVSALEFRVSGNYLRTTGRGEISGELPVSGPLRWPLVTGTASLRIPRAGILSIDLQRSYYIEEIMPGDNFSANILGIRWTREF